MSNIQKLFVTGTLLTLSACSSVEMPSMPMLSSSNAVTVVQRPKVNPNAPVMKYSATIRMKGYVDERKMGNPRKLGTGAENVSGLSGGKDILVDRDVSSIVATAMRNNLDEVGFQVNDDQDPNSVYELSGVVKELTLNVKARDEISLAIETSLREVSTGKLIWSGVVVEKNDRFAGVSGNSRDDVAAYLKKELGIVTNKTVEALSSSLMAARPDLFNLTPGSKPVAGVTVLVAPGLSAPAAAAPVSAPQYAPASAQPIPAPAFMPHATATTGLLLVNTNPTRAKVYADGVYMGISPLRVEMEPGVHAISVKLEGYRMATEKVSVRRGDNTEMELSLER